ncbi:MAG: type II toxin-antitoxin system prevent-host-death family antitoxin [Acidobacteriota bacterium]
MATMINMHDAKSSLSRLVQRAAAGEDILIARHGKPMALLTRLPERGRKPPLGLLKGKIRMAPDFDAPLEEFGGYLV